MNKDDLTTNADVGKEVPAHEKKAITKVATGQLDHSELAEQLNRMAHIFYSKK